MTFNELYLHYRQVIDQRNQNACSGGGVGSDDPLARSWDHYGKRLESQLLAFPQSFDTLRCWMVDVSICTGQEVSEQLVQQMASQADYHDHRHQYVCTSELATQVLQLMQTYHLTDSGCGAGWSDCGCHCTEAEARELINELWSRFAFQIESGLIRIRRSPWSLVKVDHRGDDGGDYRMYHQPRELDRPPDPNYLHLVHYAKPSTPSSLRT